MFKYDLDFIKSLVPMPDLAEKYGVKVRRGKCCCPFHGDRHPSMKIYDNGFNCFACGAHGDIFTWVQMMDSISFLQSIEKIMSMYGINAEHIQVEPEDKKAAELKNEYRKLDRLVKKLQPKTESEPPSDEFLKVLHKRNQLKDII